MNQSGARVDRSAGGVTRAAVRLAMLEGVNTAKSEHRTLSFVDLAAMLSEAGRIAVADERGTLRRTGNWSPGQAFGHLAGWINFGYDGYPQRPPLLIRAVGRLMKSRVLKGPPTRGMRMPGVRAGTFATEALSTQEGLARLRAAVARLEAGPPATANPVFGPLSHAEWKALHLRHGEGHLGFFWPEG
ncbi:MAG: DUF1569 domain-containing protein [Planctomycetota bacterium]|nr:DUF1569 domain-containing protein [Planctomycetota bacterium]